MSETRTKGEREREREREREAPKWRSDQKSPLLDLTTKVQGAKTKK